jgi:predicted RecA/RadA family phage recombinase
MQNYIQEGRVLSLLLAADATSGTPILMGTKLVVPMGSGVTGDTIEVATEGVFTLAKTTGEAWAQGAALYWVVATSKLSTTVGSNTLVGYAAAPALSADTTGNVKLNG